MSHAGFLRRLFLAAFALALAAAGPLALAATKPPSGFRFQIVTGDDSALTQRIAEDLYKRLVPTFAVFRTELAQRRRMVYVAVGPVALRKVASLPRCECVVISAFTSAQVWHAIVAQASPARAAAMTAIYAEPAPEDQLRLVELLYGRPVRIAAILGRDTAFLAPALRGAADVYEFAPTDDIYTVLNRTAQSEVLLALPDSAVYRTENIRNILLSTYRRKQAVVGFSGDMVKAGTLATTYSSIEDINLQVADVAAHFVASGELAPPQFPRYFRTLVNDGVARSLDVKVSDAARAFARRPPVSKP